ncbi:MAG: peptidoglycan-binding domain-containing protein [Ghiorsea sp.]|nr:peptidoglycan-binding domain-containing protein [Ghiorsea sp.]
MARPLKVFMRGKSITQLQEALRRMGYEIHDQKALFGTDTRDAVKSYQKQKGLKTTGIVDDALMKEMSGEVPSSAVDEKEISNQSLPNNQQEWDALIRLLIQKEIFTQDEWDAEKSKVKPKSLI